MNFKKILEFLLLIIRKPKHKINSVKLKFIN